MSESTLSIITTLLSGLIIPILLEAWKNRGNKAPVAIDLASPVSTPIPPFTPALSQNANAAASQVSDPTRVQRNVVRGIFTAILGIPTGLIISAVWVKMPWFIWSDVSTNLVRVSFTDMLVTSLFIASIWFLLCMFGPLKQTENLGPSTSPGGRLTLAQTTLARFVFATTIGLPLGYTLSGIWRSRGYEFTVAFITGGAQTSDGMDIFLGGLMIAAVWLLLSKYGPLKSKHILS